MGGEFAQEREWDHDRSLDWHLCDDALHDGVHRLVRDLNRLYRETPALHRLDCEPAGFAWIDASDAEQSVLVFLRHGGDGMLPVIAVCNFTPIVRQDYRIGVPSAGVWAEILNTDSTHYGGSNVGNTGRVKAAADALHGQPASLCLTLPPLSTVLLQPTA